MSTYYLAPATYHEGSLATQRSDMTAAVLERQQEIALMKAIGAQDHSIGGLFLLEASGLGLVGGVVGYIFGELLASGISVHVLGYAARWKPALAPLIAAPAPLRLIMLVTNPLRRMRCRAFPGACRS